MQRDHGDRTNRKHARLKYTIDDRGLEWFVAEFARHLGERLATTRPFSFATSGDRCGWSLGFDGQYDLALRIPAGRIADIEAGALRTGLRGMARIHAGVFRLTPNQNVWCRA